jgi:4-amino-4-deoxy-L-arabinose transferase-like glycosyltransferase
VKGALAWGLALVLAGLVLARLDYRTRDPDSVLYAQIAARLSREPAARWIAPDWPPRWYMSGPYREHPVGIFVLPALLARLGYPAEQAAYLVNAAYQVLTVLLIPRLAAAFVVPREARPLGWLLQVLPIAFTYRIRANQEPALLVCLVAALLGAERCTTRPRWGALMVAALVALALVKGVLALPAFLVCAVWLLVRGEPEGGRRSRGWWWLAAAGIAVLATAAGYEALYRQATGASFFSEYLGRQLGAAAVAQSEGVLAQKAYNVVWYLGRLLWFPFPWSLAALAAAWSATTRRGSPPGDPRALRGALLAGLVVVVYLALFSLSDRRADRYIFPAYYAIGACGAVAALRSWPRLGRAVTRADRWHPYLPVAVWAVTVALHLLAGRLHIPTIKVWAPDS